MKFSEKWLREWVNPNISTQQLAEQLTMAGLEVSSVSSVAPDFSGVIVAQVISAVRHPDAERLHCCKVDTGNEILDIVCGASNVRPNLKVALATVGADLPNDIKIKKAKLRGQESAGMLCAARELGLEGYADVGIIELPVDAPLGKNLREYLQLDDQIIEIELTPNRGDCLSIQGIAAEVAVLNQMTLTKPQITAVKFDETLTLPVNLNAEANCPHYVGRIIKNINKHAQTPLWMQQRLMRSGVRCINVAVDVCNYVMMELGQPMHAFDLDKLQKKIQIRLAQNNETITLIDGQKVQLQAGTTVIADETTPQAIAGVMGGLDSAVTTSTENIFLESAYFTPQTVRADAKRYGIQSDSSYRFERGVDYQLQVSAIERATQLLLEIVGGTAGVIIEKAAIKLPQAVTINLRYERVERILGVKIAAETIENILQALGMQIKPITKGWEVTVPSKRFDINLEIDLIEEIARVYGYDNITTHTAAASIVIPKLLETATSASQIKKLLVDRGYAEIITYSFVDEGLQKNLSSTESNIILANPIAKNMAVMRSNLLPGLIETLRYNLNRQINRIRIFEMGLCFQGENEEDQIPKLGMLLAGPTYAEQWGVKNRPVDFYDLKGDVEAILILTGHSAKFSWKKSNHANLHPGQSADLYLHDQYVGFMGKLHPALVQILDLDEAPIVCEFDLRVLESEYVPQFTTISKFPSVRRDLAFVVDRAVEVEQLRQAILQRAKSALKQVVIFDVYQGEGVEKDKKSVAIGLTFQDPSRTLVDEEINAVIQDVVTDLKSVFNAKLRI